MKITILFLTIIFLGACSSNPKSNKTQIFWIDSIMSPCKTATNDSCLRYQSGKSINDKNWDILDYPINGFDFETGFLYKIRIKEIADSQKLQKGLNYQLVEILEKQKDSKIKLHDIWVLKAMKKKKIFPQKKYNNNRIPSIEFNLRTMKIFGNDGCNSITGDISLLGQRNIEVSKILANQMACPDMSTPNEFNLLLSKVKTYYFKGRYLYLLNSNGKELLQLLKVD